VITIIILNVSAREAHIIKNDKLSSDMKLQMKNVDNGSLGHLRTLFQLQ
jgi:hypothetical protein